MVNIRVDEGEDEDVYIRLKRRLPGGTTTPIVLTGVSEIALVVKNKLADADGSAKFTYKMTTADIVVASDGSGVGAAYSEILIKTKAVDQTPPGNYYHHLDITKAARKETVDKGIWTIENT